jgi:predicted AAA+ superfamily ATPase
MIERSITSRIFESLREFPVVALIGSRQVGKTTLAMTMAKAQANTLRLDLEMPSDLAKLNDPEFFLSQHSEYLTIIDEIQRKPDLFPVIRALVDKTGKNGSFLILGSASSHLVKHSSETLAGRIIYHELNPLSLFEVGQDTANILKLWLRGGYPRSFLAASDAASMRWRNAFIKTYLERDIPLQGIRVSSVQLERFWRMLAHFHGQVWNASKIADSLGVSAPTVNHWADILEGTFIVRRVQPWFSNAKKRVVKSPKMYLRDSGLLHALLSISTTDDIFGHPSAGASWEGLVMEQVFSVLPETWRWNYYRTHKGAEMDLVLFPPQSKPVGIEIKRSKSPSLGRGFHEAFKDLECKSAYCVYAGDDFYKMQENVYALPIHQIGRVAQMTE